MSCGLENVSITYPLNLISSPMAGLYKKNNTFFYGRRVIGKIFGDKFVTFRNKYHFVRKYVGFGINAKLIEYLIKHEIKEVVIIYNREDGTQEIYRASPRWIKERGILDKFGNFEPQYFLPIALWEK